MSELTLVLIRFAYLAILWIFVLSAISVVRSDMFGARVETAPRTDRRAERRAEKARNKQSRRPSRGTPTHVAIIEGANSGDTISLDAAPLLIGRGSDAAIRLDDDYVSTRHARIARSNDQWFVEDLGSTNGTYLNGEVLRGPQPLHPGDRIRIGDNEFSYEH